MLSSFEAEENYTLLRSDFITACVPHANGDAVRVYLYGLYHAGRGGAPAENTAEHFSLALNIPEEDLLKHFLYWHDKGLVKVTSRNPLEVTYLQIAEKHVGTRKFAPAKYEDFNKKAQEIFGGRMLQTSEYECYYELLEDTAITQEALLMIMKFALDVKGEGVRRQYIVTVARDWAEGKRLTAEDVEERLKQHEATGEQMRELFFALGKTSSPQFEDRQTYLKWTNGWGYGHAEILYAAGLTKKKGGMARLEKILDEFFKNSCFTLPEMQNFKAKKDKNFALTLEIARRLTCYFENLDYVIESYTLPWLALGLKEEELLDIATQCFKKNKRDFEAMDAFIKSKNKKTFSAGEVFENVITLTAKDYAELEKKHNAAAVLDRADLLFDILSCDKLVLDGVKHDALGLIAARTARGLQSVAL